MGKHTLHPTVKRDFERMDDEETAEYVEAAQELLLE